MVYFEPVPASGWSFTHDRSPDWMTLTKRGDSFFSTQAFIQSCLGAEEMQESIMGSCLDYSDLDYNNLDYNNLDYDNQISNNKTDVRVLDIFELAQANFPPNTTSRSTFNLFSECCCCAIFVVVVLLLLMFFIWFCSWKTQ